MVAIKIIFIIVVSFSLVPIVRGFISAIDFKIDASKLKDTAKKIFKTITLFLYLILAGFVLFMLFKGVELFEKIAAGDYIIVLIYTLLFSITSNSNLYQLPSEAVDSSWKAFKKEFTSANVNNIFADLPLKVIINLAYLTILILAQLEDLGYCTFSSELSYFLTLNKYGIVIVLTMEKVLNGIKPDKTRRRVLLEAFVEKEKIEEKEREEIKAEIKEIKQIVQARKKAKKEKKK